MTTELTIEGMTCSNCVKHAREALVQIVGVWDVKVVLEPGKATVEHDDRATIPMMIAAIEEEGYQAHVA